VQVRPYGGEFPKKGRRPSKETVAIIDGMRRSAESGKPYELVGLNDLQLSTFPTRIRSVARKANMRVKLVTNKVEGSIIFQAWQKGEVPSPRQSSKTVR
jgi:hypothetical protein